MIVMPGLVPPARPKPLRRGEGPGIHVPGNARQDVDGQNKPGHDAEDMGRAHSSYPRPFERSPRPCDTCSSTIQLTPADIGRSRLALSPGLPRDINGGLAPLRLCASVAGVAAGRRERGARIRCNRACAGPAPSAANSHPLPDAVGFTCARHGRVTRCRRADRQRRDRDGDRDRGPRQDLVSAARARRHLSQRRRADLGESPLGITFNDATTFNLSASAKITIDNYVYEDGGKQISAIFDIGKGTIAFVAAAMAKTGDMKIATPTATLGIRGTTGVVDVPEGAAASAANNINIKLYPDARRPGRPHRGQRSHQRHATRRVDAGRKRFCDPPGRRRHRRHALCRRADHDRSAADHADRGFVSQVRLAQTTGRQIVTEQRDFRRANPTAISRIPRPTQPPQQQQLRPSDSTRSAAAAAERPARPEQTVRRQQQQPGTPGRQGAQPPQRQGQGGAVQPGTPRAARVSSSEASSSRASSNQVSSKVRDSRQERRVLDKARSPAARCRRSHSETDRPRRSPANSCRHSRARRRSRKRRAPDCSRASRPRLSSQAASSARADFSSASPPRNVPQHRADRRPLRRKRKSGGEPVPPLTLRSLRSKQLEGRGDSRRAAWFRTRVRAPHHEGPTSSARPSPPSLRAKRSNPEFPPPRNFGIASLRSQ